MIPRSDWFILTSVNRARGLLLRCGCVLAIAAAPAAARGGSITLRVEPAGYDPSAHIGFWEVTVPLEAGARLGAVNLVAVGFTGMSVNPANPEISRWDSVFVPGVFGDERVAFSITNAGPGIALAAGPIYAVLATLTSPYTTIGEAEEPPIPVAIFDDPYYFGGAIFDDFLRPVADAIVIQVQNNGYQPRPEWVHPGVPEPSSAALGALVGAALLALVAARELSGRRLRE